ncbi:MAG TPA: serine/threonine-protein kinase [Kofleriaceae bacterium]|nr:serine/threonine-protein kinase [Kofleriaceae bacterium]
MLPQPTAPIVTPGEVISGRYRIVRPLDRGGMGTVFLAQHVLLKREVAIKILHSELATDTDVVKRFMNEARAAGTLGHPNIVESTDMGFTDKGVPYIVFEFLEGTLLVDEIFRNAGIPIRRALRIANQIASALHAAHNAGIVHRDLKSENVFLVNSEHRPDIVKVIDFGISRFADAELDSSARGLVMGTPEFMAPEQILAPDQVDHRADIWALGVIFYEMLSSKRPFPLHGDPQDTLQAVVHEPAPPLDVPEAPPGLCEMILDKLLAKDPVDRYQSMKELQGAIEVFYNIVRPANSITPLSIPIPEGITLTTQPTGPGLVAAAQTPPSVATTSVVELPAHPKQPARWALLAGGLALCAVGIVVAIVGWSAPAPAPVQTDPAVSSAEALAADVHELATGIDAAIRGARGRADAIAHASALRGAIGGKDVAIREAAAHEPLLAAKPGEVIELFQESGGKLHPILHIPDAARPIAPSDEAAAQLDTDGTTLTVVVRAKVPKADGTTGGAVALSTRIDLDGARKKLGAHASAAALVGLAKPVSLAGGAVVGNAPTLPLAVGKDVKPQPLSVRASALAPQAMPAEPAPATASGPPVLAYLVGIAGLVLLVLYAVGLLRARREG